MKIIDTMTTVGYRFKKYPGEVGIEVETESIRPYEQPQMSLWSAVADHSLRNYGIEYITKIPLARDQISSGLAELNDKVIKKQNLIKDSITTSVHVHLNFLNNTWMDLARFLTTYYMVENLTIKFSGPDRLSNLFCLPMCDAEGELEGAINMVKTIGNLKHKSFNLVQEAYKYSALNLASFPRLGTLEVRSMRGTTDVNLIEEWINILLAIKDFASIPGRTPIDIVNMWEQQGSEIVYPIFGKYVKALDIKDKHELIKKNVYYASKVATASKFKDELWGFPKPKPVYREKLTERLDAIALVMYKQSFADLPFAEKAVVSEQLALEMNLHPNQVIFPEGDI